MIRIVPRLPDRTQSASVPPYRVFVVLCFSIKDIVKYFFTSDDPFSDVEICLKSVLRSTDILNTLAVRVPDCTGPGSLAPPLYR